MGYKRKRKWEGLEKVVERPEFKAFIKKEMDQSAKVGLLRGFEIVRAFHLTAEPFSQQNDILTPTFKLKRPQAHKKYKKQIDAMYSDLKGGHGEGPKSKL